MLVLGYGNPSRGDDALGPEFVRRLGEARAGAIAAGELEVLTDFQLQVEHALDLVGRRAVYLVDATAAAGAPEVEVRPARAVGDASLGSHRLSPEALLHAVREALGEEPPPTLVVAIRGERFELGEGLSEAGARNLEQALSAFPLQP